MYQHILVPFDGSPTAERGLHEAIRLAGGGAAKLLLLHVIDDFPTLREYATKDMLAPAQEERAHRPDAMLADAARRAGAAGIAAEAKVAFAMNELAQALTDAARSEGCDLIVIGTHGRRGLTRAVLGSVAEDVVRRSPVPVLLVPPNAETAPAAA